MKSRKLESGFFTDPFIENLTLKQKYLYIYYLFNEKVNWLGCYEITDRTVLFECGDGVTKKELDEAKELFTQNEKIYFIDNYVIIKNSEKYDNHLTNVQLMRSAYKQFQGLPVHVQKAFFQLKPTSVVNAYKSTFLDLDPNLDVGYIVGYEVGYSVAEIISNKKEVISNKKEERKEKLKKIDEITEEDMQVIADKYQVPLSFVRSKYEDLVDYCNYKGKTYKDYLAALRQWVKKDAIQMRKEVSNYGSKGGIDGTAEANRIRAERARKGNE